VVSKLSGFDEKFRSDGANHFGDGQQFSVGGKDLIFPI